MNPDKFELAPVATRVQVHLGDNAFEPLRWGDTYLQSGASQVLGSPMYRILVSVEGNRIDFIKEVLDRIPEPFGIYYIPIFPPSRRVKTGRYHSPQDLSRTQVKAFLDEFRDFLSDFGEHHIWIIGFRSDEKIVWESIDYFNLYLRSNEIIGELIHRGFMQGEFDHYRTFARRAPTENEDRSEEILRYFNWDRWPLEWEDIWDMPTYPLIPRLIAKLRWRFPRLRGRIVGMPK